MFSLCFMLHVFATFLEHYIFLVGGGVLVKNEKKSHFMLFRVLWYFQHFRIKTLGRGGGGWVFLPEHKSYFIVFKGK